MIDMSGWASVADVAGWGAAVLTREQVRALLEEGRECRADVERRMRAPVAHMFTIGCDRCRQCGVLGRTPAAARSCPGYMAGP